MGTRRYVVARDDFKGAYDSGTTYPTGSFVRHDGSLWMALRPVSGVSPAEGADWSRYVERGDDAYERAVANGYTGSESEWLDSLVGLNAYEVWLAQGNSGTQADFLADIKGEIGDSAFERAVADGFAGTEAEWLESLVGPEGPSAYEVWLAAGNTGTEADFFESLRGPDGRTAYQVAVDNGFTGTESEWLESLTGDPGAGVPDGGSDGDYIRRTSTGSTIWTPPVEAVASSSSPGFMSAGDKAKLNDLGHGYVNVKKGADQAISYSTPMTVTWELEDSDLNGYFAGNRYTPQREGRYEMWLFAAFRGLSNGDRAQVRVYKNGNLYVALSAATMPGDADYSTSGSVPVPMNGTTDYIEAVVAVYGGGGSPLLRGDQNNRMIIQHTGASV